MLQDDYVTFEIGKAKHIALVAHDGKKKELVEWCDKNKEILKGHFLCGTGTTSRLIAEKTGLRLKDITVDRLAEISRSVQKLLREILIL